MWSDVVGFECTYEVNESGEVRNKVSRKVLKNISRKFAKMKTRPKMSFKVLLESDIM